MADLDISIYDDSYSFIRQSLQEYDNDQTTVDYITKNTHIKSNKAAQGLDPIYNITGLVYNDNQKIRPIMTIVHNETGVEVMNTEYEVLGIHHETLGIWCWAWAFNNFKQNAKYRTDLCEQLLHEALLIEDRYMTIKSIITCGRRKLGTTTDLDVILSLSRYMLKMPIIPTKKVMVDGSKITRYLILVNKKGFVSLSKLVSGKKTDEGSLIELSKQNKNSNSSKSKSNKTKRDTSPDSDSDTA